MPHLLAKPSLFVPPRKKWCPSVVGGIVAALIVILVICATAATLVVEYASACVRGGDGHFGLVQKD